MMRCCWTCRACTFWLVAAIWLLQGEQQLGAQAAAAISSVSALRKTTTMTTRRGQANTSTFLTYTTTSDVQEEALLDRDVLVMGARLGLNSQDGMDQALSIYQEGRLSNTSLTPVTLTLQTLSTYLVNTGNTYAADTMSLNGIYLLYQDYYGVSDYANQWILGAFQKRDYITSLNFKNGIMDFRLLNTTQEQATAIQTAVVVMSFWMKVVQGVYEAIDRCSIQDTASSLVYWDQAVAFYTGSTITEPTSQGGVLLYSLAQDHCKTFGTCDPSTGMAKVNTVIFTEFKKGQENLQLGNCLEAKASADRIETLMQVPLIQGTLSSMYAMDYNHDGREMTRAQGAAYAAAVLPLLDECSPEYAKLVYRNLEMGLLGSFGDDKEALESQYDCLRITCEDVGGIADLANPGQYMKGAEPCVSSMEEEEEEKGGEDEDDDDVNANNASSNNVVDDGLEIGLLVALAAVLILLGCTVCCLCRRRGAAASEETQLSAETKPSPEIKLV